MKMGLGVALFVRGDRVLAIEHFRRALKIDPRFAETRDNLEHALVAPNR